MRSRFFKLFTIFTTAFLLYDDFGKQSSAFCACYDVFGEGIRLFYDRFIALCKEKGICPSRAVEAIGMNRASAVKWKNGTVPGGATLHKLAEYFGVSVDYLLDNEETPDAHGEIVRLDADSLEVLRAVRERPDMKILFSVSKNVTPEDLAKAIRIVDAFKAEEEGE